MTKLTSFLAIGFMVNSIILTTMKSRESKKSLFDNEAPVAAPLNSDVEALNKKGLETTPAVPGTTTEATAPATTAPAASAPAATETNTKK